MHIFFDVLHYKFLKYNLMPINKWTKIKWQINNTKQNNKNCKIKEINYENKIKLKIKETGVRIVKKWGCK